MHSSAPVVMTFFLLAGILVAPHLTWPEARKYAMACMGLALMFWWLWPE